MGRKLLCCLLMLAFVVPVALLNTQPANAQQKVPKFDQGKCQFDVPKSLKVVCGTLTVLEQHDVTDGPTIKLAVAIFKAAKTTKPKSDPILYLDGGPGGHTLEAATFRYFDAFAGFAQDRDFIMFDQRGVGFSEPALDCPETTKAINDNLGKQLTTKDQQALSDKALVDCHARLVKAGINLAAYNSAETAADVEDLRVALGYKSWNLYGISYGTRLALTVMRDYPDGLRSVILDSTVPLQVDLYSKIPEDANRAFNVFFDACLKSLACNGAFPNLNKVFYDLVARLDTNPATLSVKDPYTGKTRKVLLDGDTYVNILYHALYSIQVIIILPKMIWQAHNSDFRLMELIMSKGKVEPSSVSEGMYFSVQCGEEVSFDDRDTLTNATTKFPKLASAFDMANYYDICQDWNVPQRPAIEKKAVTSAVPTLVLAGEYDPITPPGWGYLASQTLKHSYYLQFPGVGHGVSIGDTCPYRVTQSFLKDPSIRPDIGCMSFMGDPVFITK